MKNLFTVIYLFCFVFLSACCEEENCPTQPPPQISNPTLTGNWEGSDTSHSLRINALLTEANEVVTGSGRIIGISQGACIFSGVNIYPNVSLTLFRTNENDVNYTGEFVSKDIVVGVINGGPGGGWHDLPITFVRQ